MRNTEMAKKQQMANKQKAKQGPKCPPMKRPAAAAALEDRDDMSVASAHDEEPEAVGEEPEAVDEEPEAPDEEPKAPDKEPEARDEEPEARDEEPEAREEPEPVEKEPKPVDEEPEASAEELAVQQIPVFADDVAEGLDDWMLPPASSKGKTRRR
jgi:hypothetical protein